MLTTLIILSLISLFLAVAFFSSDNGGAGVIFTIFSGLFLFLIYWGNPGDIFYTKASLAQRTAYNQAKDECLESFPGTMSWKAAYVVSVACKQQALEKTGGYKLEKKFSAIFE